MTYLEHHGILGQKWGVRRFQNEDGSLTEAGKKRYLNSDGSLNDSGKKKYYVNSQGKIEKIPSGKVLNKEFNTFRDEAVNSDGYKKLIKERDQRNSIEKSSSQILRNNEEYKKKLRDYQIDSAIKNITDKYGDASLDKLNKRDIAVGAAGVAAIAAVTLTAIKVGAAAASYNSISKSQDKQMAAFFKNSMKF